MRIVIQRVKKASVEVDGKIAASISHGLLLLVGIAKDDSVETAVNMARKIADLRIFEDGDGKMNLNIRQAGGCILSVSQFTVMADTHKGNRPGFDGGASPSYANEFWEVFNNWFAAESITIKKGIFGAKMLVELVNDGPVTFILDSHREK
ncbi:MAG: D-tyrosyl-tRNA(Tyr) deacylase [Candidatus Omnitrophica bacterium]|nr:D-tyrosyl-tRNA(Tyr) deacylase [Candidatus Omnitrophota bacterium]